MGNTCGKLIFSDENTNYWFLLTICNILQTMEPLTRQT